MKKTAEDRRYDWPGFIWKLIDDESIQNEYGTYIWCFIPIQWIHWWINSITSLGLNVTLNNPQPSFVDVTSKYND